MLNRSIKSKKVKQLIKKFEDEDEEQEDNQIDEVSQQEEIQLQTKLSLKQILSGVINKEVKGDTTILAEKQQLLHELNNEKSKHDELKIKKSIKKIDKGHVDPRIATDKILERELKVIASKGLVKVFKKMKQIKNE